MTFGKLEDPALLPSAPSGDAAPPDDDSAWRQNQDFAKTDAGVDPEARKAVLLQQCEQRLDRAWAASGPRSIAAEVEAHSCTALKGGRECVKCRMCPTEGAWTEIVGYYRGQKQKIFICAEKAPSQEEVESTLTHQLSIAYDHCRQVRAPLALARRRARTPSPGCQKRTLAHVSC